MVNVVIVQKNAKKKQTDVKKFKVDELYKKCNLRKKDNFEKRHTWNINDSEFYISVFSKDKGRANTENKYDLPPPLDNELYFGSLILIKHTDEDLTDDNATGLTLNEWETVYENLFGGFEDIEEEEESSEDELEKVPANMKTKNGGYLKDGFVVDDDDDDDDEDFIPDDSGDEDDDEISEAEDVDEDNMGHDSEVESEEDDDEEEEEEEEDEDSDLGSELSEESYIDSDDE